MRSLLAGTAIGILLFELALRAIDIHLLFLPPDSLVCPSAGLMDGGERKGNLRQNQQ
jgi:hypothetical protein